MPSFLTPDTILAELAALLTESSPTPAESVGAILAPYQAALMTTIQDLAPLAALAKHSPDPRAKGVEGIVQAVLQTLGHAHLTLTKLGASSSIDSESAPPFPSYPLTEAASFQKTLLAGIDTIDALESRTFITRGQLSGDAASAPLQAVLAIVLKTLKAARLTLRAAAKAF